MRIKLEVVLPDGTSESEFAEELSGPYGAYRVELFEGGLILDKFGAERCKACGEVVSFGLNHFCIEGQRV